MTATGFPTKDEILRPTVQIFFIPFSYINIFLLFTFLSNHLLNIYIKDFILDPSLNIITSELETFRSSFKSRPL